MYKSNELCKVAQSGISHFVLFTQCYKISQLEEDEMCRARGMYGIEEETVHCFAGVTEGKTPL
jgi:hypothetical protein